MMEELETTNFSQKGKHKLIIMNKIKGMLIILISSVLVLMFSFGIIYLEIIGIINMDDGFWSVILIAIIILPMVSIGGAAFILNVYYSRFKEYEKWVKKMNERFPSGWDESRFGFVPFFTHSEFDIKGKLLLKEYQFDIYENGIVGPSSGLSYYDYIPWKDIERIYLKRLSNGELGWLFIETIDLKFAMMKVNPYISIIKKQMGNNWKEVFYGELITNVFPIYHSYLYTQSLNFKSTKIE